MTGFERGLRERAAAVRRRIAFPESLDERTLAAVAELQRERLVEPVLIGPSDAVRTALAAAGGDSQRVDVLDPSTDSRRASFAEQLLLLRGGRGMSHEDAVRRAAEPLIFGALLVRNSDVAGAVAGAASTTADVLRAALWCIGAAPAIRTISSAFYMCVAGFRGPDAEVLTFTDAGVVPEPTAEQLVDIAQAACLARASIVGDEPRVAFLSYSTHGSAEGAGPQRMRRALGLFRERMPGALADGELQADAALIADVAARKAAGSPLAGRANVLVFPDLGAANIAYKLVQRLAGAAAYGPILQGLAGPWNDLSRGARPADIVTVACITALQA
ncbi:MAG: phosphate acyltransferase [Longimicrobiales bacterium]